MKKEFSKDKVFKTKIDKKCQQWKNIIKDNNFNTISCIFTKWYFV